MQHHSVAIRSTSWGQRIVTKDTIRAAANVLMLTGIAYTALHGAEIPVHLTSTQIADLMQIRQQANQWIPFQLAAFVVAGLIPIPLACILLTVVGGIIWDPMLAIPINLLGHGLGAASAFGAGRLLGSTAPVRWALHYAERRAPGFVRLCRDTVPTNLGDFLALRNVSPLPFAANNYVFGMSPISARIFAWGTLTNFCLFVSALSYVSHSIIEQGIAAQDRSNSDWAWILLGVQAGNWAMMNGLRNQALLGRLDKTFDVFARRIGQ